MADTVKTLLIDIKVNSKALEQAKEDAELFDKPLIPEGISQESFGKVKETYLTYKAQTHELENIVKLIEETTAMQDAGIGDFSAELEALSKRRGELEKSLGMENDDEESPFGKNMKNTLSKLGTWFTGMMVKWGENIKKTLTDAITDAWEEASEMASYDLGTSLISNSSARNTALQYGLSGSQNWAYGQVSSLLNITSEEDLFYMNDKQRAKFAELMDKYTAKYEEYNESGIFQTIQEFQLEWEEFKLDLQMDFLGWFADNKDLIRNVLNALMGFLQWIVEAVGNVLSWFDTSSSSSFFSGLFGATDQAQYVSNVERVSNTSTTNNQQSYQNYINVYGTADVDQMMSKTRAWFNEYDGG